MAVLCICMSYWTMESEKAIKEKSMKNYVQTLANSVILSFFYI